MADVKLNIGKHGSDSSIEINGKPVLATSIGLDIQAGAVTTVNVVIPIVERMVVVNTEAAVNIDIDVLDERVAYEVYLRLKERLISNSSYGGIGSTGRC